MISQRKLVWDKLETTGAFALYDPIWREKEYSDGKQQLAERDVQKLSWLGKVGPNPFSNFHVPRSLKSYECCAA